MPCPPQVRLPVEPLLEITGAIHAVARGGPDAPVTSLARIVSVRPRTIHRWRAEGGIPFYNADKCALRAGFHPSEVWAEWWDAGQRQGEIDAPVLARDERAHRARMHLVVGYQRVERKRARLEVVR